MKEYIKFLLGLYRFDFLTIKYLLKNKIKKSNTLVIMATGKSVLDVVDWSQFSSFDFITLSNAYLHPMIDQISPIMHLFIPHHKPISIDNYVSKLNEANEKLPKETVLVTGIKSKKIYQKARLERVILYFSFGNPFMLMSKFLPLPTPQTSPQFAIMIGMLMRYKRVFLIGVDHDALKYYPKIKQHFFDPSEDKREHQKVNLVNMFYTGYKMHHLYNLLAKKSINYGVEIYNLNKDSWLESFKKVSLESINNL